jgi:hypothetical protein
MIIWLTVLIFKSFLFFTLGWKLRSYGAKSINFFFFSLVLSLIFIYDCERNAFHIWRDSFVSAFGFHNLLEIPLLGHCSFKCWGTSIVQKSRWSIHLLNCYCFRGHSASDTSSTPWFISFMATNLNSFSKNTCFFLMLIFLGREWIRLSQLIFCYVALIYFFLFQFHLRIVGASIVKELISNQISRISKGRFTVKK